MVNVKLFRAPRCCSLADMDSENRDHPSTKRATGRRAAVLIMDFTLALVIGIGTLPNAWAQGSGPATGTKEPPVRSQQVQPPAKPNAVQAKKNGEREIPSSTVRIAWTIFKRDPENNSLRTELFLKEFFLMMKDAEIAADQKFLLDKNVLGSRPDFMVLFDRAVAFRRNALGLTANAIFALGQKHRSTAREMNMSIAQSGYDSLGLELLKLAAKKSHVEARYIVAMNKISTTFNEKEERHRAANMVRAGISKAEIKFQRYQDLIFVKVTKKDGRKALSALAIEGYGPAQRAVAERFATGNVFPKDAVLAYYWMQRAAGQVAALNKRADALGASLSLWQRLKVRYWILVGKVPEPATTTK